MDPARPIRHLAAACLPVAPGLDSCSSALAQLRAACLAGDAACVTRVLRSQAAAESAAVAAAACAAAAQVAAARLPASPAPPATGNATLGASAESPPVVEVKAAIRAVIAIMAAHSSSTAVAKRGCIALRHMAREEWAYAFANEVGAAQAADRACDAFPTDAAVLLHAAQLLVCLGARLPAAGARATAFTREEALSACWAFHGGFRLAKGAVGASVVESGLVDVGVRAIAAHAVTDADIAVFGLSAVRDAALWQGARLCQALVDAGALQAIATALDAHAADAEAVASACGALFAITHVCADSFRHAQAAVDAGCLAALRSAGGHLANVAVAINACGVLANFAASNNGALVPAVLDAGGVAMLARAVEANATNGDLTECACMAISVIAKQDRGRYAPALADAGGITVILQALESLPSSATLCGLAWDALADFIKTDCPRMSDRIADEGGIPALVRAVMTRPDDVHTFLFVCTGLALVAISECGRRVDALVEAGCARAFASALRSPEVIAGAAPAGVGVGVAIAKACFVGLRSILFYDGGRLAGRVLQDCPLAVMSAALAAFPNDKTLLTLAQGVLLDAGGGGLEPGRVPAPAAAPRGRRS